MERGEKRGGTRRGVEIRQGASKPGEYAYTSAFHSTMKPMKIDLAEGDIFDFGGRCCDERVARVMSSLESA
jgi:hypothetical protein